MAVAVLYGLYLRLIAKPERYKGSHGTEGIVVLVFILTIMVSLLVMNGLRQNLGDSPIEPAYWQPVSALIGSLLAGLSEGAQNVIDKVAYWASTWASVLIFLTMLPGGKHFHVVTSIFNVFLRDLEAPGRLPPARQFDGLPRASRTSSSSPGADAELVHLHRMRALPGRVPGLRQRAAALAQAAHHGPARPPVSSEAPPFKQPARGGLPTTPRYRPRSAGADRRRDRRRRPVGLHDLLRLRPGVPAASSSTSRPSSTCAATC